VVGCHRPSGTRTAPQERRPAADAPRDVQLNLTSREGPVSVRSSEVTSIRVNPEDGSLEISSASKKFTVEASEKSKLTPFMQRQVEMARAVQKKK